MQLQFLVLDNATRAQLPHETRAESGAVTGPVSAGAGLSFMSTFRSQMRDAAVTSGVPEDLYPGNLARPEMCNMPNGASAATNTEKKWGGGCQLTKVARAGSEGAGDRLRELSHAPDCEDPVVTVVENSFLTQPQLTARSCRSGGIATAVSNGMAVCVQIWYAPDPRCVLRALVAASATHRATTPRHCVVLCCARCN